jgi:hypothetical protein
MELSPDMVVAMEKLAQNPDFIENLARITQTALISLYSLEEDEESDQLCPSYYLFVLNYIITNNLKFELLLPYLPQ